jgi:hypothetical protein
MPNVTPRRGRGASPGRAQSIESKTEPEMERVGPRASAGERPAVIRDATAQTAEPPDNQLQSQHNVAGTDRPRSGPATFVGETARTRQRTSR